MEATTAAAQIKKNAMEFAMPRAYDGNNSQTKNHGIVPNFKGRNIIHKKIHIKKYTLRSEEVIP